jgi:DNA-directed RNA polymerase subunit RPC12/RpoP
MIKIRTKSEDGNFIEQEINKYYLEKWIEEGTLIPESEIWSDELTGGEWKKIKDLRQYQKILSEKQDIEENVDKNIAEELKLMFKFKCIGCNTNMTIDWDKRNDITKCMNCDSEYKIISNIEKKEMSNDTDKATIYYVCDNCESKVNIKEKKCMKCNLDIYKVFKVTPKYNTLAKIISFLYLIGWLFLFLIGLIVVASVKVAIKENPGYALLIFIVIVVIIIVWRKFLFKRITNYLDRILDRSVQKVEYDIDLINGEGSHP